MAGAAAEAQAAAEMEAADAAGKDRLAALSDAFGIGTGKIGQMAAASAADAFSESTLALARAQPEFVREIGAPKHMLNLLRQSDTEMRRVFGCNRKRTGQFRGITVRTRRVSAIFWCCVVDASACVASDAAMAA